MARKADFVLVNNIIDWLKSEQKYDENTLTFYKCKYLLDNNMCSIYEERPSLCVWNLLNGWGFIPSGCGFESWMFMRREEDMQKIRHAKEELLDLKVMKSKTKDEKIVQLVKNDSGKVLGIISYDGNVATLTYNQNYDDSTLSYIEYTLSEYAFVYFLLRNKEALFVHSSSFIYNFSAKTSLALLRVKSYSLRMHLHWENCPWLFFF